MKIRLVVLSMLATMGLATAQNWIGDLLQPTNTVELCRSVYNSVTNSQQPQPPFDAYIQKFGNVTFQSPRGSIYSQCESIALRLEPLPANNRLLPVVVVFVGGTANTRSIPEGWVAALVLLDQAGLEVARLAFNASSRRGFVSDWPLVTSSSYQGRNTYYFELSQEFAAAIPRASRLVVLVSRGQGVERFEVSQNLR